MAGRRSGDGVRERGFIALPVGAYAAIGAAVVIAGLGIAVKVQTSRLAAVKAEHAGFVAQVKAIGEAAEKAAKLKEAEDLKRKEDADAETARVRRDLAGVYDAYKRLRDSPSRRTFSEAGGTSASPARACLDAAAANRALQAFDAGVAGLLEEGDRAIVDINTARRWAKR